MNKEKFNERLEEIKEQSHIKNVNIINEEYKDSMLNLMSKKIAMQNVINKIAKRG